MDEHILNAVKSLIGKGGHRSLDVFINEALQMFATHKRRILLDKEMELASRDERFLADIRATMEDFKYVNSDSAGKLRRQQGRAEAGR